MRNNNVVNSIIILSPADIKLVLIIKALNKKFKKEVIYFGRDMLRPLKKSILTSDIKTRNRENKK